MKFLLIVLYEWRNISTSIKMVLAYGRVLSLPNSNNFNYVLIENSTLETNFLKRILNDLLGYYLQIVEILDPKVVYELEERE